MPLKAVREVRKARSANPSRCLCLTVSGKRTVCWDDQTNRLTGEPTQSHISQTTCCRSTKSGACEANARLCGSRITSVSGYGPPLHSKTRARSLAPWRSRQRSPLRLPTQRPTSVSTTSTSGPLSRRSFVRMRGRSSSTPVSRFTSRTCGGCPDGLRIWPCYISWRPTR